MSDNRQIKDGLGNLFTVRMRDVSAAADGSMQRSMILATPYSLDYGAGGIYQHCARPTAPVAAGAYTSVPIYSFMWVSALYAAIHRVRIQAWTNSSGFAATSVGRFALHVARSFTAQDTGGTAVSLAGENNQLFGPAMAPSAANIVVANGAPLTPGTRTLDPDPIESMHFVAPTTFPTLFSATPMVLLDKRHGEHPLLLAQNNGFVINATVPASGNWQFAITVEWAELPIY